MTGGTQAFFNVQQWLQRLMFYGKGVQKLYSVQPLPSCTIVLNKPSGR